MKIKDIKPGMLAVAYKKGWGELEDFRKGLGGMDAVVLAVGQYRLQTQGVCGTVIAVPNPYDSTKRVVIMRPRTVYSTGKPMEWTVDLVSPTHIMPHAEAKERREEWQFIKDERDRLGVLKMELLRKLTDLVNADTNVRKELARQAEISPWQSGGLIVLSVRTGHIRLDPSICTAKTKKALAPIMEDLINIDKQLTCKV